jgi:hypothetical protein
VGHNPLINSQTLLSFIGSEPLKWRTVCLKRDLSTMIEFYTVNLSSRHLQRSLQLFLPVGTQEKTWIIRFFRDYCILSLTLVLKDLQLLLWSFKRNKNYFIELEVQAATQSLLAPQITEFTGKKGSCAGRVEWSWLPWEVWAASPQWW